MRARDNPFRVERLHALAYRLPAGLDWPAVFHRLAALGQRAAVVGPEGHGKTTFLLELAQRLEVESWRVTHLRLEHRQRWFHADQRARCRRLGREDFLLVDSVEQLSTAGRAWLAWASRRAGGVVVTSHQPDRLPTLLVCETTPALLADLLAELLRDLGPAQAVALGPLAADLFHHHQGNVRAVLRALYDRLAASRQATSLGPTVAYEKVRISPRATTHSSSRGGAARSSAAITAR